MNTITDLINKEVSTKVRKTRYTKPESVKKLETLHFRQKKLKHPTVPYLAKTLFRDDSANGLTRCIIAWLELHGHFAGRVNTTGTYNAKLGKYIHSGARKGMSDITSVINGIHVSIEVKHGRDLMRPEQIRVKNEIERAGGVYIVARSFDDFLEQINQL